jgi:hypothetical protein
MTTQATPTPGVAKIDAAERDGFTLTAYVVPDHDYRPGEDDEIYPRLTREDRSGEGPEGHAFGRRFHGVAQGDLYYVEKGEIDRLRKVAGHDGGGSAVEERWLESVETDAAALADGSLGFVGVLVKASRAGIVFGEASLRGLEDDHRSSRSAAQSLAYQLQIAEELCGEALQDAEAKLAEVCGRSEAAR